ncbi:YuiB family protein [Paenibacillus alba]|uniref:YuiB family protein n=1 Tax=Paenibacillus alba TaxID=1197127 RepID=A0ABU6G554_9BACL|nr:YuiB family protein [Paenibacillus alba]MEC0228779.1 YuiB family protein [Paenibacillus alba]
MLQMVIATVLMMVLFFGIGFILNMLMKTTWFPLYAFIALVIGVVIYGSIGSGSASFLSSGENFTIVDIVPAIGGLAGAILSGSAIKALRIRGFKMF